MKFMPGLVRNVLFLSVSVSNAFKLSLSVFNFLGALIEENGTQNDCRGK